MKKLKNIIYDFVSSGQKGGYETEGVRKAIIINLFAFVGFLGSTSIAIISLFEGKMIYGFIILFFSFLIISIIIFLRKTYKFTTCSHIIIWILITLFTGVFIFSKINEGAATQWFFVLPLLSLTLLGKKTGLIYAILFLLLMSVLLCFPPETMHNFSTIFKIRFLSSYSTIIFISFFFEYVREKNANAITNANNEISNFLAQTILQKEEIQSQAEQLSKTNLELEKFSIAASETDNAIMLTDANGNFEWVNQGFVRLFGYTLDELNIKIGRNLIHTSYCPEIKDIVNKLKQTKKTQFYESFFYKNNQIIWTQTTLTPILNNQGNIIKIIAIDTDISKQKEAEEAIKLQNEEISKQHELLNEQTEKIKSSIRYALTIQNAILPSKAEIDKYFENFILFLPKDIVSGDFYWFHAIRENDRDTLYFSVVDCTGHGVPGGFMSIIGKELLDKIIIQNKVAEPASILTELNNEVILTLKPNETDIYDGMDMGLCKIEKYKTHIELTYSAAKRPLYYIKKDSSIVKLKGERRSIGGIKGVYNSIDFTNQKVILESGEIFYLSTDGFVDQCNINRHRFGSTKLLRLLNEIHTKPLNEQYQILIDAIQSFMINENQRDDITLIGIRV